MFRKIFLKNNYIIIILFFIYVLTSCSLYKIDKRQTDKEILQRKNLATYFNYIASIKSKKDECINKYVDSLSIEDKVCQLFIINISGDIIFSPVEQKKSIGLDVTDNSILIPGGYLFFSYNLANTPEKIMRFTDSIRNICNEKSIIAPFLAIDQEGGFVNRLKTVNGPLPSNERVAKNLSVEKAYVLYSLQARQMYSLGFNMNVAPVVEVCNDMNKLFLEGRSFGEKDDVIKYSVACVNAYQNNGIAAVPKHFPGNSNTDPHTGLPEISMSKQDMDNSLQTFKNIINRNPSGILMSHARTLCLDSEVPACLSHKWVSEELKDKYGFEGIVFSDDIFMKALSDNGYSPDVAAKMAIDAGVDCIMISEKRFSKPARVLIDNAKKNKDFSEKIDIAVRKIINYKIKCGLLKLEKNNKGDFRIENITSFGKIDDRLVDFRKAQQENINFYIDNFD